ncbi:MAG TPA: hypothetical protein VH817_00695 [Thermoleophilaceae bacterium]
MDQMAVATKPQGRAAAIPLSGPTVRDYIDATTRALVDAEERHARNTVESVRWERRGLLRRLVRVGPG